MLTSGVVLEQKGSYFVFPELESIPYFSHGIVGRQGGFPDLPTDCTDAGRIVRIKQVHSDRVVTADEAGDRVPEADGIILTRPGTCSVIKTADCVPILIVNPHLRHIVLVHAGWRGTRSRITEKAVEKYLAGAPGDPSARQLTVAFGPAIRRCCYEVGPEVRDAFAAAGFPVERLFDGRRLGLVEANRFQAEQLHLNHFLDSGVCTCCDSDRFYSYRRNGTERRILTFAGFIGDP